MANLISLKLSSLSLLLLIVSLLLATPRVDSAVTCNTVLTTLTSCINYVKNGGPVPPACCDGIKALNARTQANPDLQDACRCIKSFVPSLGARPDLVNGLPGKCGISFPYQYSPTLDCSKIHR